MVENIDSEIILPVFEAQLCHLLDLWPWTSYLNILGLDFLICKMGIAPTYYVIVSCENYVNFNIHKAPEPRA